MEKIKLIILDVDGTMTDGSMYYTAEGDTMKKFNVKDGMGIVLLKKAGFKIAIMTSEDSPIAASRANKLGVDATVLGCKNKTDAVKLLADDMELHLEEVAFMGDDVTFSLMETFSLFILKIDINLYIRLKRNRSND